MLICERLKILVLTLDIRKRGILRPVLVSSDGAVLDGHKRVKIAKKLDIKVPVLVLSAKTRRYRLHAAGFYPRDFGFQIAITDEKREKKKDA